MDRSRACGPADHRGRNGRAVPHYARRKDDNDLIAYTGDSFDHSVHQPAAADQRKLLAATKADPTSRRKDDSRNTAPGVHDLVPDRRGTAGAQPLSRLC